MWTTGSFSSFEKSAIDLLGCMKIHSAWSNHQGSSDQHFDPRLSPLSTGKGGQESKLVGVRIFTDGQKNEHDRQSWASYIIATVSLLVYLGWLHLLFALTVWSLWSNTALIVLIAIWSTVLLPAKPVPWPPFADFFIFKHWRRYFSYSYAFEEPWDVNKKYVCAHFPHGVYPFSELLGLTLGNSLFPGFRIFFIAADAVFSIPMWRHFLSWLGGSSADEKTFKALLKKGSVGVVAGGIAEMYALDDNSENIYLRKRRGFVRLAIEEGVDIIPVYHFGNSRIAKWGPKSLQNLSRKCRVALGLGRGVLGLPLPFSVPLFWVSGKAIPVTKCAKDDPDFDKRVDEVHAQVVDAVQALYDKYKGVYGWNDRPLNIL